MQRTFVKLGNTTVRTSTVFSLREGDEPDTVLVVHTDHSTTYAKGISVEKASEMLAWAADDANSFRS
jgi:hypothetical protein